MEKRFAGGARGDAPRKKGEALRKIIENEGLSVETKKGGVHVSSGGERHFFISLSSVVFLIKKLKGDKNEKT